MSKRFSTEDILRQGQDHNDIEEVLPSFKRYLAGTRGNKPKTVRLYSDVATALYNFLGDVSVRDIKQEEIDAYLTRRRRDGLSPASISTHYRSLQQLFAFLLERDYIETDPMARMTAPLVPAVRIEVVTPEDIQRLLAACEGRGFDERRDMALISFMLDTGCRRGEVTALRVGDVNLDARQATVTGKTGTRTVAYGNGTADAMDAYGLMRNRHRDASSDAYWLGMAGPMTGEGVYQAFKRRARQAGLPTVYPHQMRHTWADQMMREGRLPEGDVMQLGGWNSRQMLDRYGASNREQRALSRARSLSLLDAIAPPRRGRRH